MTTLPMFEDGSRSERVEYGERLIRDCAFGRKGQVNMRPNDYDPHDGAYYAGGPKTFEVVQRAVITYVGHWETVA